jgi:hypothetical protein
MRLVDGFSLEVGNISSLNEEQRQEIIGKLRVLAVSTQGLFDDPVLRQGEKVVAYYIHDYYADETRRAVAQYLQEIGMDGTMPVLLRPAQWYRSDE